MQQEKYGFVYIWYDRKHKRFYVGCHWGTEGDGYICSSRWMRQSYRRRPEGFKRRVIARVYTNRQDLLIEEGKWLSLINDSELGKRYYNLTNHTNGHWSANEGERLSVKEKASKARKEFLATPEGQASLEAANAKKRGIPQSPEHVAKRAASIKKAMEAKFPLEERRVHLEKGSEELSALLSERSSQLWANRSEEERAEIGRKISEANRGVQRRLGHINSENHRQKISSALTGRKHSEERKKKIFEAHKGKKMSEEFKAEQSRRLKELWARRKAGELPMPDYSKEP